MIDANRFLSQARTRYLEANRNALVWQLDRMSEDKPWINTKCSSISLNDYDENDGLRGPQYTYGWIQGRGLEAMVSHADYFETIDASLSGRLYEKSTVLYRALNNLVNEQDGAYFCYDENWRPICTESISINLHAKDSPNSNRPIQDRFQSRDPGLSTYSDLFVTKGLIAAAQRLAPDDLPLHLQALDKIITDIRQTRFLIAESGPLSEAVLTEQSPDYGPMMIAMGAASLLHRTGLGGHDSFSGEFLQHILECHMNADTGLLTNSPGGSVCNIGHAIELAGFVLDIHSVSNKGSNITELCNLLVNAFRAGFNGKGVQLSVGIPTLSPVNAICPWWSLPETIRAASLGYELTGNTELLDIWGSADNAFFTYFWRDKPPIAYQSMNVEGPVDYVPATPDLDPGYHTGLSLLAALEVIERCSGLPSVS